MNKSEIVFKIEKILKDYSCESSPLKIADIVRKLSQENIYCNRKTVKSNIELLINAKGEIAKSKKGSFCNQNKQQTNFFGNRNNCSSNKSKKEDCF